MDRRAPGQARHPAPRGRWRRLRRLHLQVRAGRGAADGRYGRRDRRRRAGGRSDQPRPGARQRGRFRRGSGRRGVQGDQPQCRLRLRVRVELFGLVTRRSAAQSRILRFARVPASQGSMKLATYNLNGIRARLPRLLEWLEREKPDVVCLQELKCADESLPIGDIEAAGYGAVWHGQKGFNGVAILAREKSPDLRRMGLPGDPDDSHSRYIEAEVDGLIVASIYLPNGNPVGTEKFDYKIALDGAAARPCGRVAGARAAGGAGRRLQRRPRGPRRLFGQGDPARRLAPARDARRSGGS